MGPVPPPQVQVPAPMSGYILITLTVLLTVYGQLVLKWQSSMFGPLPAGVPGKLAYLGQMLLNPWVISGLGAAFAASLCWMLALRKLPLSTAYPFTAASFVLVLLFAVVLFNEPVTLGKVLGTAMIVGGILVMAMTA